jgi:peptide/nickel transport system ATP-binding protein
MQPLVDIQDLRVAARNDFGEETLIVKDVSFSVAPGEVVALIGESGSGKTTIALSVMGYARSGCRIVGGHVRLGEKDILSLSARERANLYGREISYIPQSAAAAFNPAKRLMTQIVESARIHRLIPPAEAEAKAQSLFVALALPDPLRIGRRYPHQVSGGQLQRLLAAMALLTDPKLLIFDEPTTALDVTTQIEVLRAFKKVIRERGATALYVSHDLAVVAQMADRIVVLRDGQIREVGTTRSIIDTPQNHYTKAIIVAADPEVRANRSRSVGSAQPIAPTLEVRGVIAGYGPMDRAGQPASPVLNDISFSIRAGATVGVVGESGCGKSTLARVIAGLLPPAKGTILLDGTPLPGEIGRRTRQQLRKIQIVFQMADTALNPSQSVTEILGRPLQFYHEMGSAQRRRRIAELLDKVKLPAAITRRYPGELSGGQKQRLNLARALAAEPAVILCDEVTSALDTVVGAAVLDLLAELQRDLGIAYMFISHDLSTVRAICDEIMILYSGQMMEFGSRNALRERPFHPYSDLLISSVPELRPGWLDGVNETHLKEAAAGVSVFKGARACSFFNRCAVRIENRCDQEAPPLRRLSKGTEIRCQHTEAELLAAQELRDQIAR